MNSRESVRHHKNVAMAIDHTCKKLCIFYHLTTNASFLKICILSFHTNDIKTSVGHKIYTYLMVDCAK